MTFLEQLQADQTAIASMLETQRLHAPDHTTPGMRITTGIYIHILEDAISVLNSIIQYLAPHD